MITLEEARRAILEVAKALPPRRLPLDSLPRLGQTLAEDVASDLDLPPFRKALMDGYAVRSADLEPGRTRLKVVERIVAGAFPTRALVSGEAAEIMTGAPLPEGADAVAVVEHATVDGDHVVLDEPAGIAPGRNFHEVGREARKGACVLKAGTRLNPLALGVLASIGQSRPLMIPKPRVAIVPTGDELVEPDRYPGLGQIRNSNATMLRALVQEAGFEATSFPIAPDDPIKLRQSLQTALDEADVLLISGGVSAGKLDLVPDTLSGLGVRRIFHKVRIKPGKPIWFGLGPDRVGASPALVFGLPGNPLSSVVGFVLLVREALERLAGFEPRGEKKGESKALSRTVHHKSDRPAYHPARLDPDDRSRVALLDWNGSSDLNGASSLHGFVVFEAGERTYHPDEMVDFLPIA